MAMVAVQYIEASGLSIQVGLHNDGQVTMSVSGKGMSTLSHLTVEQARAVANAMLTVIAAPVVICAECTESKAVR